MENENDAADRHFDDQAISNFTSVEAAPSVGNDKGLIDMIDTSRRVATLWTSVAAATFMIAAPAFSQGPTDAQRAAIKSQCRSDYMAHCASVPPGGAPALQCLQKNIASLSSSCQSAVRAVEASVEKPESKPEFKPEAEKADSKPESAPTEATAKPSAEPAPPAANTTATKPAATKTTATKDAAGATPNKPSNAQIAAIRSACRSDYPKVCAGVPTGGAPALQCLEKNKSKLSAGCEQAVTAASGGTATSTTAAATPAAGAAAAPAAAAPATAPSVIVLRPMRPREELFVLRSACGVDVRSLCGGVPPGGGRILQCLATQAASLSPDCRGVLGQFAAQ
jgi:hypothetical protein